MKILNNAHSFVRMLKKHYYKYEFENNFILIRNHDFFIKHQYEISNFFLNVENKVVVVQFANEILIMNNEIMIKNFIHDEFENKTL